MPDISDRVGDRIFGDPIALDDIFAVQENAVLDVSAALGLLANDGDPDGGSIRVSVLTDSVDNGSVTVFQDGRFTYTPDPGFVGEDSFDYQLIDDDGNTTISTVTITVYENSAPVATNDHYTIMENDILSVGVPGLLRNDLDTAGEDVFVSVILDGVDNGSQTVFPGGNFSYTPDDGFVGSDSFTYRIRDSDGNFDTATATINVIENPGPTAGDDFYTLQSGTVFSLAADGILANDIDPDGSALSVSIILDSVDNGNVVVFPDGRLTYTPDPGFSGTDTLTYRIRDASGNTDTATVTFTVVEGAAPIATDDHFVVREGESLNIAAAGLLTNDIDAAGGSVAVDLITNGADDGSLVVFPSGSFDYTPDDGFSGLDSFSYRIRNDNGEASIATASITVVENLDPIALDDAYSVQIGSTLNVNAATGVLSNDFDPEGEANAVTLILDGADNGDLVVFPNGRFNYTPDLGFAGQDSFTYRMRDAAGNTDTATVTIDVYFGFFLVPPVALDDAYIVGENRTLEISASLGVLANDYDANANSISVTLITDGADNGDLIVFPNGRFNYTPDAGFVGTDSFTYRITDSTGETSTATATIIVAENTIPVALPDYYSVFRGQTLSVVAAEGLLVNDLDPEGTDLTVSLILDGVDNGELIVFGNGNFTYEPDAGFVGTDSFTYRVRDEDGEFSSATVTLNVEAPATPVLGHDEYSVLGNRELSISAADGLLANDLSLDGSGLTVTLLLDGVDNGDLIVFPNGRFEYTPDAGFVGVDSFTYRVTSDNGGIQSETVDINVVADPDPVAGDDAYSVIAGNTLDVSAQFGLLLNDIDPAGDALSVTVITNGVDNGNIVVFGDGRFTYTPDAGFSGTDTFTYRITDAFGFTDTADVTINVVAPAAPIALENAYLTYTGVPLSIAADYGLLSNDVSPDGLGISVTLITDGVDNGSLVVFADGRFNYTPDAGFAGVDSFTYRITDEFGSTATAEVAIGVHGNAAPVVADDEAETQENQSVSIDVLNNDMDPNGDPMSIGSLSNPANGTVVVQFGEVLYTPDPGFSGEDTFTYRAVDPAGLSNEATVTVTVNPIVLPAVNYMLSSQATVAEGDVGSQIVTMTITRDDATDVAFVALGYSGDATLGIDYMTDAPVGVNFAAGVFSQTVDLSILGDTDIELDEDITITIDDVVSFRDFVGDTTSTVILNDDIGVPPPLNEIIDGEGSGVLIGTAGADSLQSNGGRYDRMTGGAGADEFEFGAESNNGLRERDLITDYEVGVDALRLVEGATIQSSRDISSGVLVTLDGDGDRIYVRGDGVTADNLTILMDVGIEM